MSTNVRPGILVHYAELGTKGGNRRGFIEHLIRAVEKALKPFGPLDAELHSARLWVQRRDGAPLGEEALAALDYVPGIAWSALALQCPLDLEEMRSTAWQLLEPRSYQSFRVKSRRAFKELPYASQDIDRHVGGFLHDKRPAQVTMKGADVVVYIEAVPYFAFVFLDKRQGLGGLPAGSGGRVACLLSGGIDSPVAAFKMLRRGCKLELIHFHSHPFQSRASAEKATELAEVLSRFGGSMRLHLVPLGEAQRQVVLETPESLRVVLYRRLMVRMAAAIAQNNGAKALVTGESLGQVASQTLTNMTMIEDASPLCMLRPLVACDKLEIIREAQKLGTFAISTQPDEDCCQLFVPERPETHARLANIEAAESKLDIPALVADAVARTEILRLGA